MDPNLATYLAQPRHDRHHGLSEREHVLYRPIDEPARWSLVTAARRSLGTAFILAGKRLQGATALPVPDHNIDAASPIQTSH